MDGAEAGEAACGSVAAAGGGGGAHNLGENMIEIRHKKTGDVLWRVEADTLKAYLVP